jgi:hypothetical protein
MRQRLANIRTQFRRRWMIGPIAAVAVLAVVFAAGGIEQSNRVLTEMGFDPDRAQLITALLLGAIAAAAAVMAGTGIGPASVLGCLGSAALFAATFVTETQSALASTGDAGSFDPSGWVLTLATLVVAGLVAAWAGAALASVARPTLAVAADTVTGSIRRRSVERGDLRPLAPVVGIALVLVLTVPIFGDIVNYTPDSHMLQGAPADIGLGGPQLTAPPSDDLPTLSPTPSPTPSPIIAAASASATASAPASPTASPSPVDPHPWLAWTPVGVGHVNSFALPGPWKSGTDYAEITVYTPPGYTARGTRHYPVLYEAPYAFSHWNDAAAVEGALDSMIDRGTIPPVIVVTMTTDGGVFTDSECTDSFDGREWFDTYASTTVVQYMDSHYHTIATPAGRAVIGASQGGYCAAALVSRHPDVFGTALVYSGYFHAGRVGPPSTIPFGTNQAFIDAASPDVLVLRMTPEQKASIYFVLYAQLSQALYGYEAVRFDKLLTEAGIAHVLYDAPVPHGWAQIRRGLPGGMGAWAARMVALGVFSGT